MSSLLGTLIPSTTTTTSGPTGPFVRVSKDISNGEKKSIAARKKNVVVQWYARRGITVDPENVPVVAIMLSGGGLTAMFACIGALDELKKQDLLDAALYTFGCSGSTWGLTSLNDTGNWSENLPTLKDKLAARVAGLPFATVPGLLKTIAAAEREDYSLTDLFSYVVVTAAVKELNEHVMSSWRTTQESGDVPYVVNAASEKVLIEATDWKTPGYNFEFTVHECGFPDQGVFVDTTYFESKFDNNKLIKKEPEPNLTFMQGIWGSAFGSLKEVKGVMLDTFSRMLKDPWSNLVVPLLETLSLPGGLFPGNDPISKVVQITNQLQGILSLGGDDQKKVLADMSSVLADKPDSVTKGWIDMMSRDWDTSSVTDKTNMVQILPSIMAVELNGVIANIANFVLKTGKALLTWDWGTTNNFSYGLTSFPDPLKDRAKVNLVDSGFGMMIPFPLGQRPERNIQLYIACDFYPLDPFRSATKAAEYSAVNNIPFPTVTIPAGEEFNPSQDCYVYEETNKPTVMYFPLFNKVNTKGLMKLDTLEYILIRPQYTRGELDMVMDLSASNIRNNAPKIQDQLMKLVAK